jgi:type II secretory pathway predicted ATPase ExeA
VGKTTLLQQLLQALPEDTRIGLISNAQGGRGDLLRWVTNALEVPETADMDYVARHQALQDFLIAEYGEGRRVAVVIDEAQNLSAEALEELRMLTNINAGKDELLQLILVGQPELRAMIMRPDLQQFAQRVVGAYHLATLSPEAARRYLLHRLAHAGAEGEIFAPEALEEIVAHAGGVPRLLNKLAEFCLVYGAIAEERPIGPATVRQVLSDGVYISGFVPVDKAAE